MRAREENSADRKGRKKQGWFRSLFQSIIRLFKGFIDFFSSIFAPNPKKQLSANTNLDSKPQSQQQQKSAFVPQKTDIDLARQFTTSDNAPQNIYWNPRFEEEVAVGNKNIKVTRILKPVAVKKAKQVMDFLGMRFNRNQGGNNFTMEKDIFFDKIKDLKKPLSRQKSQEHFNQKGYYTNLKTGLPNALFSKKEVLELQKSAKIYRAPWVEDSQVRDLMQNVRIARDVNDKELSNDYLRQHNSTAISGSTMVASDTTTLAPDYSGKSKKIRVYSCCAPVLNNENGSHFEDFFAKGLASKTTKGKTTIRTLNEEGIKTIKQELKSRSRFWLEGIAKDMQNTTPSNRVVIIPPLGLGAFMRRHNKRGDIIDNASKAVIKSAFYNAIFENLAAMKATQGSNPFGLVIFPVLDGHDKSKSQAYRDGIYENAKKVQIDDIVRLTNKDGIALSRNFSDMEGVSVGFINAASHKDKIGNGFGIGFKEIVHHDKDNEVFLVGAGAIDENLARLSNGSLIFTQDCHFNPKILERIEEIAIDQKQTPPPPSINFSKPSVNLSDIDWDQEGAKRSPG